MQGDVLSAGEEIGCFDLDLSLCGPTPSSPADQCHDRSADNGDSGGNLPGPGPGRRDNLWRVGLACCFDLRFPRLTNMLTLAPPQGLGCDMLLYPSAWLASTGELGHWDSLLRARALDGQVFVVGANQTRRREGDLGPDLFGRSCLVGPLGEVLASCEDDMSEVVVEADFSRQHLEQVRGVKINLTAAKKSEKTYAAMLEKAFVTRSETPSTP